VSGYDIAIAGAGPAGSVFALLAARAGYRVLLAERSTFRVRRIAETAPPVLRPTLRRLGLEHLTRPPFCCDAPELLSIWGVSEPMARNHIFSPYGSGIHFDRCRLDEALADAARDAGADLRVGRGLRFIPHLHGGYTADLGDARERCRIAIVATGRCGGGLGLPYARQYLDDQVAVIGHLVPRNGHSESRMIVEAIPGGWFYLAGLPDSSVMAVLVTLATLVPAGRRERLRWYVEALARTSIIRRALNGYALPQHVSVTNARASVARAGVGDHWLAIGDARIALDPLTGRGLLWAIEDAVMAMQLIADTTWPELADRLRARTSRELESYLDQRSRVYAVENRFEDDTYWASVQQKAQTAPRGFPASDS
jgi:flavin-dependent dehydrogenase